MLSTDCQLTLSLPEASIESIVVFLTFRPVDETLVCDHSNKSYWAVLSRGTVCFYIEIIYFPTNRYKVKLVQDKTSVELKYKNRYAVRTRVYCKFCHRLIWFVIETLKNLQNSVSWLVVFNKFIILSTEGWTYTYKALNIAKNELFQSSNGARPGVSKVCTKETHTCCLRACLN